LWSILYDDFLQSKYWWVSNYLSPIFYRSWNMFHIMILHSCNDWVSLRSLVVYFQELITMSSSIDWGSSKRDKRDLFCFSFCFTCYDR
jgi:hypothetical protein